MRVLHLSSFIVPPERWGGPARSVTQLACAQRRAGIDVRLLTAARQPQRGDDLPADLAMEILPSRGPERLFFAPALLARVWRQAAEVDLIHLHDLWTYPTIVAALLQHVHRVPWVVTPRGALLPWGLTQKRRKKRLFRRMISDGVLRRAAAVVVSSQLEARLLPPALAALPCQVVANPVDIDALAGVAELDRAPAAALRALMLGRVHAAKGFDLALPALAQARRQGADITLTIVGPDEGGHAKEVRRLIARHDLAAAVQLRAPVAHRDLPALFAEHALVLMPSHQESFGMAAAEAMAAGRGVIVSERAGIAESLAGQEAGLVVAPRVDAVAEALLSIWAQPQAHCAQAQRARALARRLWHPDRIAQQMAAIYRRLG